MYHVTLANIWDAIVQSEKQRLEVDEIDENELMQTILRDNEPEDLEKGRRLLQEGIDKEKTQVEGKNKIEEGSSSAAELKASEIEEYNPDDPLIPLGPTPPAVGGSAASLDGGSAEGISIFSP